MTITVLGATGHIGRRVVDILLTQGYSVIAFCHGPNPFPFHNALKVVSGDVHLASDVKVALHGADAVICALGSWQTPTQDMVSSATGHLVKLMPKLGINRLVTLTGADARMSGDHTTFFQQLLRPVLKQVAPKILADSEKHLELLQQSSLAWTCLRSPVMRSFGSQGRFSIKTSPPPPWATIHRQDVATALVQLAVSDDYIGEAVFIR